MIETLSKLGMREIFFDKAYQQKIPTDNSIFTSEINACLLRSGKDHDVLTTTIQHHPGIPS